MDDALSDPQIAARQMIETVDHPLLGSLKVLGIPTKLSETPGSVRRHPPLLGEHTKSVLTDDLGLDAAQVADLESLRVVRACRR